MKKILLFILISHVALPFYAMEEKKRTAEKKSSFTVQMPTKEVIQRRLTDIGQKDFAKHSNIADLLKESKVTDLTKFTKLVDAISQWHQNYIVERAAKMPHAWVPKRNIEFQRNSIMYVLVQDSKEATEQLKKILAKKNRNEDEDDLDSSGWCVIL